MQNRSLSLEDGRRLGYVEYGPADGRPVFYFHGHPGSRLEWAAFDDRDVVGAHGVRLIAVDRPGMGRSDFQRGRTLLDWPADVAALADELGLDEFAVLGISGGGPYAAACAYQLGERISKTLIVSGMGPADAPGCRDGLAWTYAGKSSLVRRVLLWLTKMGVDSKPERVVEQMREAAQGPDKALLDEQPDLADKVIDSSFKEALRPGIAGVHWDAELYRRPWGFRLEDIRGEVHLWHGGGDLNVPLSVGTYVADAIDDCHATFADDEGHLSLIHRYLDEYIAEAAR